MPNNTKFDKNTIYQLPISIEKVILPLNYSYAITGDLLVKVGDYVKKGQAITKNIINNPMAIAIHSPIDGYVNNIDFYPVISALSSNQPDDINNKIKAIEIVGHYNNDHEDNQKNRTVKDLQEKILTTKQPLSKETFLNIISQYGIIGLGGAGFPSAKKLATQKITTLVINAVECESPIAVDNSLIMNNSYEIIHGIKILSEIFDAKKSIIALKETMVDAKEKLEEQVNYNNLKQNIEIQTVEDKYPNGYSKSLINLLTNQSIPNYKHSSDYGIICLNVATIYAIEQAVNSNKPLTERIVTITGDTDNPGNYLLPIGTPLATIIKAFNIDFNLIKNNLKTLSVKIGGDYMGHEIFNSKLSNDIEKYYNLQNTGIDKTTQAIQIEYKDSNLEHTGKHYKISYINKLKASIQKINNKLTIFNASSACIKCNKCEDVCPVNLQPQQLYWYSKNCEQDNNKEILKEYNIAKCMECGLCDTVCPSNILLAAKFKHIKTKLKIADNKEQQANLSEARNILHIQKLEYKKSQKNKVLANREQNKKDLLASVLSKAKKKTNNEPEIINQQNNANSNISLSTSNNSN